MKWLTSGLAILSGCLIAVVSWQYVIIKSKDSSIQSYIDAISANKAYYSVQIKKVSKDAEEQKKAANDDIQRISDKFDSLQQHNATLQSKFSTTTRDAATLKRLAAETSGLLATCHAEYSNMAREYRSDTQTALEFKSRLEVYEK